MRFSSILHVYLIRKYFKILLLCLICIKFIFSIKCFDNLSNYKSIRAIKSYFLLIFTACHNLIFLKLGCACWLAILHSAIVYNFIHLRSVRIFIHSFIYSFIHSFIYLFIHSFIQSFINSFI